MTDKNEKGFAGLTSLASTVEIDKRIRKEVPSSTQKADKSTGNTTATEKKEEYSYNDFSGKQNDTNSRKVGLFIVAIIIILLVIGIQTNTKRKETITNYKKTPNYTDTQRYEIPKTKPKPKPIKEVMSYEIPPVGTNRRLYMPQIRWCLREKSRLDILELGVTNNTEVDRFNIKVKSYNSRCGQFTYRRGDLERAKQQVANDPSRFSK